MIVEGLFVGSTADVSLPVLPDAVCCITSSWLAKGGLCYGQDGCGALPVCMEMQEVSHSVDVAVLTHMPLHHDPPLYSCIREKKQIYIVHFCQTTTTAVPQVS